jgi:7,8-dihydro-6-hydroxymethylpterin dimethyltransferase
LVKTRGRAWAIIARMPDSPVLTNADIAALQPRREPAADALGELRARMHSTGQWTSGQMAGRRWPVACVSLEVTQRCNLDCTLCYLSESAESVRDFPLEEIFRRIDLIHAHYGPGTDVQVSGGEPTLRPRDELIAIVARLAQRGLRPSLLTNGIKATRELLAALRTAGLVDVAFHVDTTQQRPGYRTEADLNPLRESYVERARGLRLSVFFNTSVHAGNLGEVAMLAAWFKAHADVVGFASFQLQADTGRGVWRERDGAVTQAAIQREIERGVGAPLHFNTLRAGHHDCNRSAVALVAGEHAWDAFADEAFIRRFMGETAGVVIDRRTPARAARSLAAAALARPRLAADALRWALSMAWRERAALWRARGRVRKLTFFTHNFMSAGALDGERIEACVFMAMTQHGPMSMCAFNAQRNRFLLEPLATTQGPWQPLRAPPAPGVFPVRVLRGREREAWLRQRQAPQRPSSQARP